MMKEQNMKDMKSIDLAELKAAIKDLNKAEDLLEQLEAKPIRTVGIKKEDMVDLFVDMISEAAEAELDNLVPNSVAEFYNSLFDDEEGGDSGEPDPDNDGGETDPDPGDPEPGEEAGDPDSGAEDPEPKKKGADKKKGAGKKKKTGEKDPEKVKRGKALSEARPRSCYGHMANAKSGIMDEMLKEGTTYGEMCEQVDVTISRVKGHIKVLKEKGLTLLENVNEKDPMKTEIEISEKELPKE
jgi:DNA-binding transcriptional ArsR family regulator